MNRRDLLILLTGVGMVWPPPANGQKAMSIVGYIDIFSPPPNRESGPVHQGLRETGYVEGQNMAFEGRWAENRYDRLPALAADLVSRKVDVIVTNGGTPAALAAKSATSTIPIVFINVGDPVRVGLVTSLARPGGNLTGFSNITVELMPKLLELITELVPQTSTIALLVNPNTANAEFLIRDLQQAARAKGVELLVVKAGTEGEIDAAFASLVQLQAGVLVVDPDGYLVSRREQLVALASRYAVPAIYAHRAFTAVGGLISYGHDSSDDSRQAGIYAGRILKGAKPADLPVQQPTRFELIVNLMTAKSARSHCPALDPRPGDRGPRMITPPKTCRLTYRYDNTSS
jgi:putative tryptophan/tyrosine transport system substrate-binding protein